MVTGNVLTRQSFKTTADGTRIFFPYGAFGKGRVVDTDAMYHKIIKHQYFWFIVPFIVASMTLRRSLILFITSTFIMSLVYYISTQILVNKLQISEVRITWKEVKFNISKIIAFSKFTNWLLILSGVIILYIGTGITINHRTINNLYLGVSVTSLGIGLLVLAVCSILNRRP